MSWWRIDDGAADHPKFLALEELGPARYAAAVALWWRAGCYTAKHRLDGLVPAVFLRRSMPIPRKKRAAEDLVSVGLWVRIEPESTRDRSEIDPRSTRDPSGNRSGLGADYAFHDWRDRNPTATERAAKTSKKTERQRRWREKKRREAEEAARSGVDASTASTGDGAPIPSHPIPNSSPNGEVPSGVSAPADPPHGETIRKAEERWGKELVRAGRDAVGLSRKSGKIADSVWARTLEKLAAHGDRAAGDALRVFVERYGDGDKGEGYLVAIARSMAKGTGAQARIPGTLSAAGIASFDEVAEDGRDQFAAQVAADENRRRGAG